MRVRRNFVTESINKHDLQTKRSFRAATSRAVSRRCPNIENGNAKKTR